MLFNNKKDWHPGHLADADIQPTIETSSPNSSVGWWVRLKNVI